MGRRPPPAPPRGPGHAPAPAPVPARGLAFALPPPGCRALVLLGGLGPRGGGRGHWGSFDHTVVHQGGLKSTSPTLPVDHRDVSFDFAELLMEVLHRRASDLHVTAGAKPTIRVRGRLVALEDYPVLTTVATREVIYSILTNDQRQRLETDWQLDFAYAIPGVARFRVNAYVQRQAISAAFRLIPQELPSIDDLGLPAVLHDFARRPRGMVLVTGPTGSGKSRALAGIIDEINRTRGEHILTSQDPIEFLHKHRKCIVNQREIGPDAFPSATALKAAVRQDPDVILVGEMRD